LKILYVCEWPYNLFRALIKAINSENEQDILITEYIEGMSCICEELKKSKLFGNVYFFDGCKYKIYRRNVKGINKFKVENITDIKDHSINLFYMVIAFFNYLKTQRTAKKITLPEGLDIEKYDEIHITDCTSTINFFLYHRKQKNIIYVEHGKNALAGKYLKILNVLRYLAKLRIIHGIRGSNRYIKAIEVSENKNLISDTKGKEIRELSIDKLVGDLSSEQGEFIYQIYAKAYNFNFDESLIVDMFLTTAIDGETRDAVHLAVCENVMAEYMSDADIIVIKPHPVDKTDYTPLIGKDKRCVIIPPCVSAEVFTLSTSLKVRKLINIDSSAAGYLQTIEENITLGYKYLKDKGFSYTDNPYSD